MGCAARFGGEDLAADDDLEDEDSLYYVARASGQSVGGGGGSSAGGKASIKHYPFDYCWDKAQENRANPVPIPGKPNLISRRKSVLNHNLTPPLDCVTFISAVHLFKISEFFQIFQI